MNFRKSILENVIIPNHNFMNIIQQDELKFRNQVNGKKTTKEAIFQTISIGKKMEKTFQFKMMYLFYSI